MSLYGALFSGVSGLQSQSSAMGAISDNVANVNTVGYKGTKVHFKTLVTAQVSVTQYSPGGVQSAPRMNVDIQGLLQATTSSTDMGLSGQGFFVVSDQAIEPSGYAYSRAGSFKVDKDGYLQNVAGYYLQGWPLEPWDNTQTAATVSYNNTEYMKAYRDEAGELYYINDNAVDSVNMQPLNLNTIGGTARATSNLSLGANLPAGSDIGNTEKTNALIFDSLGNSHNLLNTWTKRGENVWDVQTLPPEGSRQAVIESQGGQVYFSAGRVDFTDVPVDGSYMEISVGGAGAQRITFSDLGTGDTPAALGTMPENGFGGDFVIDIAGRTLSQVLETVADAIELATRREAVTDYTTVSGTPASPDGRVSAVTGKSSPQRWAERVAGENAVIFRNAFNENITIDTRQLLNDDAETAVIQTNPLDPSTGAPSLVWQVDGLDLREATGTPPLANAGDWRGAWINRTTGVAGSTVGGAATDALRPTNHRDYSSAMTFNGNGTPNTIFGYDESGFDDPNSITKIDWANGALNMDGGQISDGGSPAVNMFLGNYNTADGMQQLSGEYQLNYISQDGNRFGNYSGISVSDNGIVTALFDNGVQAPIFMIPVATFVNANGMNALTGNVFQQTDSSGLPVVREAGSAGAGTVAQATLESSTVDLGEEFTTMITTQRAYSAAAKIITTSDDMLEELIRIKR